MNIIRRVFVGVAVGLLLAAAFAAIRLGAEFASVWISGWSA